MVPIAIRTLAMQSQYSPFFRAGAKNLHAWIANLVAYTLENVESVDSVYLRGGYVAKFVPGISDIDFVVSLKDSYGVGDSVKEASKLRTRYRKLRAAFPMLGEMIILTDRLWQLFSSRENPSFFLFESVRKFERGEWKKTELLPSHTLSKNVRFSAGIHHFFRAAQYSEERKKTLWRSYYEARVRRELEKASRYLEIEPSDRNLFQKIESKLRVLSYPETPYEYALSRGLWGHPLLNSELVAIRNDSHQSLYSLCLSHLLKFPGNLVSQKRCRVYRELQGLLCEAMALECESLNFSVGALEERSKRSLPLTSALSKRLRVLGQMPPSSGISMVADALDEIMASLAC